MVIVRSMLLRFITIASLPSATDPLTSELEVFSKGYRNLEHVLAELEIAKAVITAQIQANKNNEAPKIDTDALLDAINKEKSNPQQS